MSTLATHFSDDELDSIRSGFRIFIRLTGLIHDDYQYRWFADEFDASSAITAIPRTFHASARMMGATKYQGQPFDPVRQARDDLLASMLTGPTEQLMAANRKRFSPLYYLLVEPIVRLFAKFDHQTILNCCDDVCNELAAEFSQCDAYGTYDDALIAQEQARKLIRIREEEIKAHKSQRKRKKKPVEESFFTEVEANEEEVDS